MKYFSLLLICLLFSCGNKEDILLPKSNVSIVKNVEDLSPIYLFFKSKGKDTLAEVNRKNSIISTNWIFNIDKRLPLKLIIPEVIKLQEKKRAEKAHKNEKAQNYYSYADSISKNLAFLPFTKVYYKMEKPSKLYSFLHFKKNGMIQFHESNEYDFPKKELEDFLNNLRIEHEYEIIFSFDKNMSYGEYIQNKILIRNLVISKKGMWINHDKEFIF
ncbi:hypothetical protein [Flavobacterium piscis]|uniref:Lipoprotein n=1 Tax=Flavobacterium piscis TaxID=1114874 RepID=A0ABU1YET0_9FLAO|nr:hypothetical protein [Flavobacterium piscis]MDR7212051.1 hypothetical protein [Flavobacterium piscis]